MPSGHPGRAPRGPGPPTGWCRTAPAGRAHRGIPVAKQRRRPPPRSVALWPAFAPPSRAPRFAGSGVPIGAGWQNSETAVRDATYGARSVVAGRVRMAETPLVHVVDDDASVRDSLAFLLESAGLVAR